MDTRTRDDKARVGHDGMPVVLHRRRSVITYVLLFFALALVLDGVAGERGWMTNRRDRQQLEQAKHEVQQMHLQNAVLREEAQRLQRADPATIEDLARRELGFIKPGEKMFIIRDVQRPAR